MPVNYQHDIDLLIHHNHISLRLKDFLKGARAEGNEIKKDFLVLARIARKRGIPIICIDSSKTRTREYPHKSSSGYYFLRGESRDSDMCWKIKQIFQHNQNWVVICGANHAQKGLDLKSGLATLGQRLIETFGEDAVEIIMLV